MTLVLDPISNGESGLSVRNKLNAIIAAAADGTLGGITMEDILALFDKVPPAVPTGLAISSNAPAGRLIVGWNNNIETDFAYYDLWVKIGDEPWESYQTAERYKTLPVGQGIDVSARVRAIDIAGNASEFSETVSNITDVDLTPPGTPIGLIVEAAYESMWLRWTPNTESDLSHYDVFESANQSPAPNSATQPSYMTREAVVSRTGLPPNTTRHFWVRAVDRDGNTSPWSARASGTTKDPRELIEFFEDNEKFIWTDLREFIDEARRFATSMLDQSATDFTDRQSIRKQVTASHADAKAYADFQILAATGPGSAIALALLAAQAELENKASAASVLALTVRVTDAEGELSSLSQAMLDVTAELEGKADAAALLILQSRVDEVEGDVIANSNAILSLQSGYGDATANANLRMTTSAGPSGYAARIGLEARTGGAGNYRAASLFIDVPANSNNPTRVAVRADEFAIATNNGGTMIVPFTFSGSTAYLKNVVIEDWAILENVIAEYLIVNDGMIPANLITASTDYSTAVAASVSWGTSASVEQIAGQATINSFSGKPILMGAAISASWTFAAGAGPGGGQFVRVTAIMQVRQGSTTVQEHVFAQGETTVEAASTVSLSLINSGLIQVAVPSSGNYTIRTLLRFERGWSGTWTNSTGSGASSGVATCPRH